MTRTSIYFLQDRCPLCGSNELDLLGSLNIATYRFHNTVIPLPAEGVSLYKCRSCDLSFKDWVPTQESLSLLYNELAGSVWNKSSLPFNDEIRLVLELVKNRASVLDIGSSNGFWLSKIGRYFSSTNALDIYKDKMCESVVNGDYYLGFAEDRLDSIGMDRQFSLVTVFDVLEHFYSAQKAFNNLNIMLCNNGFLIGETGATDSVENIPDWWYAKLIEHHIFWSKKSLSYAAQMNGLELVAYKATIHKSRRYMPHHKKVVALVLWSLRFSSIARRLVLILVGIDIAAIGNILLQDHALFAFVKR
jgi:hypothetical protein